MRPRRVLITAPATEPVDVADFRAHARIDSTAEDSALTNMLLAARMNLEGYTRLKFISQQWDIVYDWDSLVPNDPPHPIASRTYYIPGYNPLVWSVQGDITVPIAPALSVVGVYTTDDTGTETIVNPVIYQAYLGDHTQYPRLILNPGQVWPYYRAFQGFRVRVTAGFGVNATDVPEDIREAVRRFAGHIDQYREGQGNETPTGNVPIGVQLLLAPYRMRRL